MDILLKVIKVIILFTAVYFWNRYIIKNVFKLIIGFHRKFNTQNMNRIPIQLLIQHERKFYFFAALFYWLGAVFIAYEIMVSE